MRYETLVVLIWAEEEEQKKRQEEEQERVLGFAVNPESWAQSIP